MTAFKREVGDIYAAGQMVHFVRVTSIPNTCIDGKPVVVLLHGTAADSSIWNPLQLRLAEFGVESIAVDLPGHGRSTSRGMQQRVYTLAGVVDAGLRRLQFERIIVVGHSLGTAIAMELAFQSPDYVAGLLLLNGPPVQMFDLYSHPIVGFIREPKALLQLLLICLSGLPGASLVGRVLSGKSRRRLNPQIINQRACQRTPFRPKIIRTAVGGFGYPYRKLYASMSQPIVTILGGRDRLIDIEQVRRYINSDIARGSVYVWPEGGHQLMTEFPDKVAKQIGRLADQVIALDARGDS